MPRNRVTRPRQRPQNLGQNRVAQTRNNARRPGPSFQGGLSLNSGVGGQAPGQQPGAAPQQPGQCPAGQKPIKDPTTGQMRCVPAAPGDAGRPGGAGGPRGAGAPRPKIRNNGY